MKIPRTYTRIRSFSFLLLILILNFQYIFCQTKAKITDVDFRLEDRYIIVTYNLIGTLPKEEMNIAMKFVNENNEAYIPRSVINDVGTKVYGDGQKTILWDVVSDQVTMSGNWKARVEIITSRILYSGAGNALLSMIIPGLGGYYVDTKKGRAVLTTITTLGLIGFGVYEKIQANKYFTDYEKSVVQTEIDDLYETANNYNHKYFIATRAAAGVVAIDVIYVFFKGLHNRKVAKNAYNAFSGDGLHLLQVRNGLQIGYSLRF